MKKRLDNLYGMVKQDWTKGEILTEIDKISNEFESRVCKSCVYNTTSEMCNKFIKRPPMSQVSKFGCTEFERYSK